MFKTIDKSAEGVIVEKKSKFIANAFYVSSTEQAENIIKEVKKKNHTARHNCYAYRILEENSIIEKQSDDRRAFWYSWCTYTKYFKEKGFSECGCYCDKIFWWHFAGNRWAC